MKRYLILLLFFSIPLCAWSQDEKKVSKDPDISFRISTSGTTKKGVRYDVYLKSSEDLEAAFVIGLLVTVVTDKGSKSKVVAVENDYTDKLSYFSLASNLTKKELNFHSFYIDYRDYFPFKLSTSKKDEVRVFTFYTDGPCGETIRLVRGVSEFSKHRQPTQILDDSTGPVIDDVPVDQNMQNSISLAIDGVILESYKGSNYGFAKGCADNPSARTDNSTYSEAPSKYHLTIDPSALLTTSTTEADKYRCMAVPNPVPITNQLEIRTSNFEPINFKLYNGVMQHWSLEATRTGDNAYNVNLQSNLPTGLYYIQMFNALNETCVVKIVKP